MWLTSGLYPQIRLKSFLKVWRNENTRSIPALGSQEAPSRASSSQLDRILPEVLALKTTFGTKGKGGKGLLVTNL